MCERDNKREERDRGSAVRAPAQRLDTHTIRLVAEGRCGAPHFCPQVEHAKVDTKLADEKVDPKLANEKVKAKLADEQVDAKLANEKVDVKLAYEKVEANEKVEPQEN